MSMMLHRIGILEKAGGAAGGVAIRNFNGVDQYIYLRGATRVSRYMDGAKVLTAVARITLDENWSAQGNVISIAIGDTNKIGFGVDVMENRTLRLSGRSVDTDGFQSVTGVTVLNKGVEYTIFAEMNIDGDTGSIYINDGAADVSAAMTFGNSKWTLHSNLSDGDAIAANLTGASPVAFFKGMIRRVGMFRRSLTSVERSAIASGASVDNYNPALYWPMDESRDLIGSFAHSYEGGSHGRAINGIKLETSESISELTPHGANLIDRFVDTRVMRIRGSNASDFGIGNDASAVKFEHAGVDAVQRGIENTPKYQEIGGFGVLQFDHNNSETLTADLGRMFLKNGFTIVAMAKVDSGARILSLSADNAGTDERNGFALSPVAGLVMVDNANNAQFSSFSDYTVGSTGISSFAARWSGNHITNWLNGSRRNGTPNNATELSNGDLIINAPADVFVDQLLIGSRANSTSRLFTSMDLYDCFIVNGALSDEDVQYLIGILHNAYGQTALLPAGHPWKSTAPTVDSDINYPWGNSMIYRSGQPVSKFPSTPTICKSGEKVFVAFQISGDESDRSYVFVSENNKDWRGVALLDNHYECSMWRHTDNNIYMLSMDRSNGNIQITKTTDEWATWSTTTLSNGTLLAAAGTDATPPNYKPGSGDAPLYQDGYIFIGYGNRDPNSVFDGDKFGVLYIDSTLDLMNANNWQTTSQLAIGSTGLSDQTQPSGAKVGMIESNVAVDDLNAIYGILRLAGSSTPDKAVFIPLTWDGSTLSLPAWDSAFIKDWPGGNVRFGMVKNQSALYSIVNDNTAVAEGVDSGYDQDQRNRVVLLSQSTADLSAISPTIVKTIIDDADLESKSLMSVAQSIQYHGVQYPAFFIESGKAKIAYRIGWSGSKDRHDSNFIGYGETNLE